MKLVICIGLLLTAFNPIFLHAGLAYRNNISTRALAQPKSLNQIDFDNFRILASVGAATLSGIPLYNLFTDDDNILSFSDLQVYISLGIGSITAASGLLSLIIHSGQNNFDRLQRVYTYLRDQF